MMALLLAQGLSAQVTVSLSPSAKTLGTGATSTFAATVGGTADTSVVWSSSPTTGLVSTAGLFTAPATAGTYTVTATSHADVSKSASATVTVVATPNATVTAASPVAAGATGLVASVPSQSGATYTWTVGGGTLTAGQGTNQITYSVTASAGGSVALGCAVTNGGLTTNGSKSVFVSTSGAGVFTSTGNLVSARLWALGTVLPNGKVLVAGGQSVVSPVTYLSSAEVYDPAAGTWSTTGGMSYARSGHALALLPNGKVLVAGGSNGSYLNSAELYDPATGAWSATGSMASIRWFATMTVLPNGKVLMAGGYGSSGNTATCELYDPATGTWSATGSLNTARRLHSAVLLANGKVLVIGGYGAAELASAELYDPATGTWSTTGSMASVRRAFTAALLPNGKVLVADGYNGTASLTASELYDPAAGTWSATGSTGAARSYGLSTALPNGKTLVYGGTYGEVYDPSTGTFGPLVHAVVSRQQHVSLLLPSGKVLIAGGVSGTTVYAASELFDPQAAPDPALAPSAAITAPVSVTTGVAGQMVSVPATAGATYVWSLSGGTITGGQGTNVLTYTPGAVGTLNLAVFVTSALGIEAQGSASVNVVAAPNAIITASASAGAGLAGIKASVPSASGMTYLWTVTGATITAGATTNQVTYTAAATPGPISLQCKVINAAGDGATGTFQQTTTSILDISGTYTATGSSLSPIVIYQQGTSATAFCPYTSMTWTGTLSGQVFSGTITASTTSTYVGKPFSLTFGPDGSTFTGTWNGSGLSTFTRTAGLVSVWITPTFQVAKVGTTAHVSSVSAGSLDKSITYTVSGGGSVDQAGNYSAPVTACMATITATPGADPSKAVTSRVEVTYDGILDISGTYTATGSSLSPIVIYQQGTSATAFCPYTSMTWTGTLSGQVFSGTITASTTSGFVGKPFSLTFNPDGSTFTGTWNGSGLSTFTRTAGLVSVWITPTFQVAKVGTTAHVSSVSAGSFDKSITYTVSGGGSVDQAGNYSAPATPCMATITATPGADASKAVTSTVEVTTDGILDISGTYTAAGSSLSPIVIYQQGTSATAFCPYTSMTWTGTLSGQVFSGTITASTTSGFVGKPFSLTFSQDGTTFTGTWNGSGLSTFIRQAGLVSVAVLPAAATVPVDRTQAFTAIVAGSLDKRLTPLSVQETGGGTLNASGVYTPPATAGTYHVTATSVVDSTKSGTATITVPVTLHMTPTSAQLALGANQTFTAQVLGSTNQGVTWTVLEGSAGGSITSGGVYTAPLTNSGTFHVQATSVVSSTATDLATITVSGPLHPTLTIAPGMATMSKGGTQTFVAVVQNASNPAVTWSCTGGSIDQSGHYTAPNVFGTFTVTAALSSDLTILDSATVVVPGGSASGAFTYDANGNLTGDGTRTFEWDAENRLTAVTVNTGDYRTRSEFSYDEMGRRVQIREYTNNGFHGTMVLGSTDNYLWDGAEIVEDRDATGDTTLKHFYDRGFVDSDGTNFYYTRDHLGSIRELTDATQLVRARYDYDPYGRMTKVSGDKDSVFGYTGHFWHAQSGLNLALFRAYDPNLGRWISRDPIREQGGINLYGYVSNNPIQMADPLGLCDDNECSKKQALINSLYQWNSSGKVNADAQAWKDFWVCWASATAATATAGAGIGAAVGALTGPGAIVASPGGAIIGGTIGGAVGFITGAALCSRTKDARLNHDSSVYKLNNEIINDWIANGCHGAPPGLQGY